jgi:hypothetical protein
MKKSELKSLLKVIVQEVIEAKKAQLSEAKGLSGFKKSSDKKDNTQMGKYDKNITSTDKPKEKSEGKKLPVVKKPANPQKVGDLKEEILNMVREALDSHNMSEMARVKGAVGSKFKVQDTNSPTGWSVKGHNTIPDGTPTEAPKGPYVAKGFNPNMGRPKKAGVNVDAGDDGADDDDSPEAVGGGFNSTIDVVIDGDKIGQLDLSKIKGSAAGYLGSMLRANGFVLKPDSGVSAKLDQYMDMYVDDMLPAGASLDLQLGTNSIELV